MYSAMFEVVRGVAYGSVAAEVTQPFLLCGFVGMAGGPSASTGPFRVAKGSGNAHPESYG